MVTKEAPSCLESKVDQDDRENIVPFIQTIDDDYQLISTKVVVNKQIQCGNIGKQISAGGEKSRALSPPAGTAAEASARQKKDYLSMFKSFSFFNRVSSPPPAVQISRLFQRDSQAIPKQKREPSNPSCNRSLFNRSHYLPRSSIDSKRFFNHTTIYSPGHSQIASRKTSTSPKKMI